MSSAKQAFKLAVAGIGLAVAGTAPFLIINTVAHDSLANKAEAESHKPAVVQVTDAVADYLGTHGDYNTNTLSRQSVTGKNGTITAVFNVYGGENSATEYQVTVQCKPIPDFKLSKGVVATIKSGFGFNKSGTDVLNTFGAINCNAPVIRSV